MSRGGVLSHDSLTKGGYKNCLRDMEFSPKDSVIKS